MILMHPVHTFPHYFPVIHSKYAALIQAKKKFLLLTQVLQVVLPRKRLVHLDTPKVVSSDLKV